MTGDTRKKRSNVPRPRRLPNMHDFQFFNEKRLRELYKKESDYWEHCQTESIDLPEGQLSSELEFALSCK